VNSNAFQAHFIVVSAKPLIFRKPHAVLEWGFTPNLPMHPFHARWFWKRALPSYRQSRIMRNPISGKEGEIGAVRTIGHSVIVGQTRYSYTYTQPLRAAGANLPFALREDAPQHEEARRRRHPDAGR
jgi:hypothetical protein